MALRTSVTELLGIRRPVLQAPMARYATPQLAAAVSEAGGLGALGSAVLPPDDLLAQAAAVREATDRPFLINFFCHEPPQPSAEAAAAAREALAPLYEELELGAPPEPEVPPVAFDSDRLGAALEIRPAVVSFHFGLPDEGALGRLREAGIKLLSSATTTAEAVRLEELGVDAVIAQGAEAGGHRGSFLVDGGDGPVGTLALVPQVVDAVRVPVIAAGGIADGRGLAAVLALGAGAASMGTAFLTCPESGATELYRDALGAARDDSTAITRAFSGRPARALRNRLTDQQEHALPFPAHLSLTAPLAQAAAERGSAELMPLWAGQAAALGQSMPAAELVRRVCEQAERITVA
jgi:nitronate monooxygenase